MSYCHVALLIAGWIAVIALCVALIRGAAESYKREG